MVIAAFLGRPIVPFGHHEIVADGFEMIKRAAKFINSLGEVRWQSPAAMLRTSYLSRQEGSTLRIELHSSRVECTVEEGTTVVFANPEILSSEGEQEGDEGCLSFPGIYERVDRPNRCRVRAQDIHGVPFELDCEGLGCRAIFHELDHLEGRLMIDYLSPLKRQLVRKEAKKGYPNNARRQKDKAHREISA